MKINSLKDYHVIIKDDAFDSIVYVCRHKKTLMLEFFEKVENEYIVVSGELRKKLEGVYKYNSGGVMLYKYSTDLGKTLNIYDFSLEHKTFRREILKDIKNLELKQKMRERDKTLKFISLKEYKEKMENENLSILNYAAGGYSIPTHEIIIFPQYLNVPRIKYHEYLHALASQNDHASGFEILKENFPLFTSLNEYYTEYLVKKKYNHEITYPTHSIIETILDGLEDEFVEAYFDGKPVDVINRLSKHYKCHYDNVIKILLESDSVLLMQRFLQTINGQDKLYKKYLRIYRMLYYKTYCDLIDLKANACLKNNLDITKENLKIKDYEAYLSYMIKDEYKLPYYLILGRVEFALLKYRRKQKKLRKNNEVEGLKTEQVEITLEELNQKFDGDMQANLQEIFTK